MEITAVLVLTWLSYIFNIRVYNICISRLSLYLQSETMISIYWMCQSSGSDAPLESSIHRVEEAWFSSSYWSMQKNSESVDFFLLRLEVGHCCQKVLSIFTRKGV